jgi:enoyl-CoA hydratase/carnithine racemase
MAARFEMQGSIGVATLSDVPKRNALSRAIVRGMFDAIEASRRHDARALVITGDGPTFCAGANIGDLRDGWMEGSDPTTDPMRLFEALTQMPRVVVAAVNGPAVGGGFELTLSCDLVVAHRSAWFALPELGHGVIPNTALARLQQVVGMRRAFDLILTRRRIGADEALALGLVTEVVDGDARERAIAVAEDIVTHAPPGAIAVAKAQMNQHARTDWARVRASLAEVPAAEWREGLDAFSERRAVDFEKFWRASGDAAGKR